MVTRRAFLQACGAAVMITTAPTRAGLDTASQPDETWLVEARRHERMAFERLHGVIAVYSRPFDQRGGQ